MIKKAGFGGGCHWCTEAVFESLIGVESVEQGWIASAAEADHFSEAVIVTFDDEAIAYAVLVIVHLHTHSATALHAMRDKYRSAVYTFSDGDRNLALQAIESSQPDFAFPIITAVLPFGRFRANRDESLHYYFSDIEKPFCETYIDPKLKMLLKKFSAVADHNKLRHLKNAGSR